jgi:hypothetical protein
VHKNGLPDKAAFAYIRCMKFRSLINFAVLAALLVGCSTEFEVYAPEKEIRSVFCVLHANDSVQYLRLAKAFQFQGDALVYAKDNDLSITGRTVRLSSGNKTWTAVEVPNTPKEDGIFLPNHTVYRFRTTGADSLVEGNTYRLEIGTSEQADYLTAETALPIVPRIKGNLAVIAGAGNSKCLPKIALERKFNMFFTKAAAGVNYEIRVKLEFERNGVSEVATWGPTELFDANKRCNEGIGNICYQWDQKELLRDFFADMPPATNVEYTYNTQDSCVPLPNQQYLFPKSLSFEATAVDEKLSNYMTVNNPKFTDLTGVKPEYTNISGNMDAVGVFGSTSQDRKYAILQFCGEALLGLNRRVLPIGCNWD